LRAGFRINKEEEGNFIFIAGRPYRYNNSNSFSNYDFIIDNWMNSVLVNVHSENLDIVDNFHLFQNHPNPFNPSTTITYSITENVPVSLKIYDILGAEVVQLVNENQKPGFYRVKFDASNLSSGIYMFRLVAGDYVSVKKMTLLK
jgi:hypothetical protein